MTHFARYIGIDYSGAETPDSSCKGLRVYLGEGSEQPKEVQPPPSPRKYWTRRGLAEWLCNELGKGTPTIVGIDHGFSFPIAYFEKYGLPKDWRYFLADFRKHWPTHEKSTAVCSEEGRREDGLGRRGEPSWFRLTEQWTPAAKSVFQFGVNGEVASSTHAGLSWLLYLIDECKHPLNFWPFDGWTIPDGASVVAEVYPSLWIRRFERNGRDGDSQAAYVAASWLQRADRNGSLSGFLAPPLDEHERRIADIEGWILGVV
jgi:hypothetical protein